VPVAGVPSLYVSGPRRASERVGDLLKACGVVRVGARCACGRYLRIKQPSVRLKMKWQEEVAALVALNKEILETRKKMTRLGG
jgi:hypothetical protein